MQKSQPRIHRKITTRRLSRGGVEDFEEEVVKKPKGYVDVLESKKALRATLVHKRLSITEAEVERRSRLIVQSALGLGSFLRAGRIALYYPINNEVSTHLLFQRSRECGKEVYYPRTRLSRLEFVRVDEARELAPGAYGVPEPAHDSSEIIDARQLDLAFIPGVGFDRKGNRLGYGKGYYDRSISPVELSRRVGLAFGFQVVDSVPCGQGDEPVGVVVTERGAIFCEGGRN